MSSPAEHFRGWVKSAGSCPPYYCLPLGRAVISCRRAEYREYAPEDMPQGTTDELSLFDWWSLSHLLTGIATSTPYFFGLEWYWALLITFSWAVLWEFYENTWGHWFWSRCFEYRHDNFWNSVCDVLCNSTGFLVVFLLYKP